MINSDKRANSCYVGLGYSSDQNIISNRYDIFQLKISVIQGGYYEIKSLRGLHMFYLLRPILFPNLSLFFRTMLFEYPSVLSRFCIWTNSQQYHQLFVSHWNIFIVRYYSRDSMFKVRLPPSSHEYYLIWHRSPPLIRDHMHSVDYIFYSKVVVNLVTRMRGGNDVFKKLFLSP